MHEIITFNSVDGNVDGVDASIPLYNINQKETYSFKPIEVVNEEFESRIGCFTFGPLSDGQTKTITIEYNINSESEQTLDTDMFLLPTDKIESNANSIKKKASELYQPTNEQTARKIYDFVISILYRDWETDRKSTRLNSSHRSLSRMPSSA